MTGQQPAILELSDLTVRLRTGELIVDHVSLQLSAGEILGLVGESGSGKTTTALALLGYTSPGVEVADGTLRVADKTFPANRVPRSLRGRSVSYVPQNTGSALNPAMRLARSLQDMVTAHASPTRGDERGEHL